MANILRVIQHGTGRAALKIGRDDLGGKQEPPMMPRMPGSLGLMENWLQLPGLDLISHGRWAAVNMVVSQPCLSGPTLWRTHSKIRHLPGYVWKGRQRAYFPR